MFRDLCSVFSDKLESATHSHSTTSYGHLGCNYLGTYGICSLLQRNIYCYIDVVTLWNYLVSNSAIFLQGSLKNVIFQDENTIQSYVFLVPIQLLKTRESHEFSDFLVQFVQ